ncbi:unnamed protein product [Trichobilharzia szidati]|nr:unnamed protein product [Trichobilharzia szidati]
MGLVESKVHGLISTSSSPQYNKSLETGADEQFLKHDRNYQVEFVHNDYADKRNKNTTNTAKKHTILWKHISSTNRPSTTYYSIDNSLECAEEPPSSITDNLKDLSYDDQVCKSRKQVPVDLHKKQCRIFKNSSPNNVNDNIDSDLNSDNWKVIQAKLLMEQHSSEVFSGNSTDVQLSEECSQPLHRSSNHCLLSQTCRPHPNPLTTEKTSLLQKDMIEF